MINTSAKKDILEAIAKERDAAIENHDYFHSPHEFWAVLREEAEELQEESNLCLQKIEQLWAAIRCDAVLNKDTLELIKNIAIDAACEAVQVASAITKYNQGEMLHAKSVHPKDH